MVVEFMSIYIFGYNLSSETRLRMAEYLNHLSSPYLYSYSLVSLTKYAGQKLNTLMRLRMAGEFMSTFFLHTIIWLMSHILSADNSPGCLWKVDTYAFLFITFRSICLKSAHSGPKYRAEILHDWCDVLGLHSASSNMWWLSTYFEEVSMLESFGINSI